MASPAYVVVRAARKIIAHDRFHTLTQTYGNVTVEVETDAREHHMTVRAAAQRYVATHMGAGWTVNAYLGMSHYRNADGYPSRARRYSVVFIGTVPRG